MRFGRVSDLVRTWFGRGSEVACRWLGRVFGSGADGLAEVKGKWFPVNWALFAINWTRFRCQWHMM